MIGVGSRGGPLPPGSEQRMSEFTDLVATAVANAQNRAALETSWDELARLLAEQAGLRRVATLVARGIHPAEIFSVVAEEFRRLLDADDACITRFGPDGTSAVVLSSVGQAPVRLPVGSRPELHDDLPSAAVWRTGHPAQVDEDAWGRVSDPVADALREAGVRSMVAGPIIVEDRLWGAVTARASVVAVDVAASGGTLGVYVRDDGAGGADPLRGSGLVGLKDRIEALGGTFSVHSPPGHGTTVLRELPVMADARQPDAGPGD